MKLVALGVSLGAAGSAFSVAGCGNDDGGDDEEIAAIEDTIATINQASLDLDVETFLKYVTANALETVYFTTVEQAHEDPMLSFGSDAEGDLFVAEEITVDGDTARVLGDEADAGEEPLVAPYYALLVKEDGLWKLDAVELADAQAPSGAAKVSIVLTDFNFEVDDDAFEVGKPVLFEVKNEGEQTHHFGLFKLEPDVDLDAALNSDEEVGGITDIGFQGPWAPGQGSDVAYTENLEAGRYALICFLPDETADSPEEAPPHFALGMVHDFTVE
jgi:hypothetical protein